MGDSSTTKSIYTTTPIDLAIPRCENDFISIQQNATSITDHNNSDWIQTGTNNTAQILIQVAGKRIALQNSLAPGGGTVNEIKVDRSGVYKAVYSAQVVFNVGEGGDALDVELGIGFSSTSGTAIVHNTPNERIVRVQPPPGQTSGTVIEHITGSMVLRLPPDSVLRLYDRTLNDTSSVTILNADITVQRLGRDGQ